MKNISIHKKRILQFIEHKGLSKNKFYKQTGVSNGILDKTSGLSLETLEKIYSTFSEINIEWLLTGKGNMLQNTQGDTLETSIDNTLNITGGKHPISPLEENNMRNDIYKLKSDHLIDHQEIPLYNLEATAGIVALFSDNSKAVVVDTIKIPNLPKSDGALFVTGDSMYPLLKSGDIIIYKEIYDKINDIFWGEMYLVSVNVAGEEYVSIKYIQQSNKGEEYIKLVSQNSHHQPKDVHIDKIYAIALVKASIRINAMG